MKQEEKMSTLSSDDVRIIHVKVIGGTGQDIVVIGQAMQKFAKKLPFKLEALVTNDMVELQDIDTMIKELYKLKKKIDTDKRLGS